MVIVRKYKYTDEFVDNFKIYNFCKASILIKPTVFEKNP